MLNITLLLCGIGIGYYIGYEVQTHKSYSECIKCILHTKENSNMAKANITKRTVYRTNTSGELDEYKPFVIKDKSMLEEILNKESEFVE